MVIVGKRKKVLSQYQGKQNENLKVIPYLQALNFVINLWQLIKETEPLKENTNIPHALVFYYTTHLI